MASKKASPETAQTGDTKTNEAVPDAATTEQSDNTDKPKIAPLKKISIDTVTAPDVGKIKDWFRTNKAAIGEHFANGGDAIHICRIWGKVMRTTVGTNSFGDFTRFNGQFHAVSAFSGRKYKAAQCLLPKWLENEVDSVYSTEGLTVYFGYDIYLTWRPETSLGYEYVSEELMEARDDLSSIEEQFIPLPAPQQTVLALTDQSAKAA